MKKNDKLEILKTKNIKKNSETAISGLETVIDWFTGNEPRTTKFQTYLYEAMRFLEALTSVYCELKDTGRIECEDDAPDAENTEFNEEDIYDDDDLYLYDDDPANKYRWLVIPNNGDVL